MVGNARRPVFVHPIIKAGGNQIVAEPQAEAGIAVEVAMAEAQTPDVVRFQNQTMIRLDPAATIQIVAGVRLEGQPGAWLEFQRRGERGERGLVRPGRQTPIGEHAPDQKILHDIVSLRLQPVSHSDAQHILRVDGVDRIVFGKFDRQRAQALQFRIELGQLRWTRVRPRDEDVIQRGLKDVTNPVQIERLVFRTRPDARGFEGNLRAGIEHTPRFLRGHRPGAIGFLIIGKSSAHPWREIQPAEKGLRQNDLVEGIGARPGIIG